MATLQEGRVQPAQVELGVVGAGDRLQLLGWDWAQLRGEVPERVLEAEQPQVGGQQVLLRVRSHLRARDQAMRVKSSAGSIPKNLGIGIDWEWIQNQILVKESILVHDSMAKNGKKELIIYSHESESTQP